MATTFYISTSGNDTTGTGTAGAPWKSLFKATSTVKTAGDTIYINAGTYTETQTSNLAVGVNLVGAGVNTTIIKSNVTGDWSTFLNLESGSLTNGNQTISGITFDGNYVNESTYKTWTGIWITFRSNAVIKDCNIINFYDRGVIINGNGDNRSTIPIDPKIYSIGNKVIDCTFKNTARNTTGYIAGQLNIGGTKDMIISGNTMIQDQRVAGKNGELIKYWGSGYNMGLRILNNTLKKANFTSNQYNGSNGDWNFAVELFNNSGLEIANNIVQGSLDINYNRVVSPYTYSTWIHDNILDHNPVNTREEAGIIFEFETAKAIVENNKFMNKAMGISFNIRTPNSNGGYNNPKPVGGYSATVDVTIKNNLFHTYSNYSYGNCCGSVGIQFLSEGDTKDGYVRNLLIANNTFVNRSGNAANSGIDLSHFTANAASTDGITIRNNIFQDFVNQYLEGGSPKMLNTVTKDNCTWNNGNSNNPNWTGALTNTGNLKVNPILDSNYSVPSNSPIYGLNIGYQATAGPTNTPPTCNAGSDQTITLPTNSVSLIGSGADSDGTIVSYAWTKTVGGSAVIVSPSNPTTTVSGLGQGTYTFRLTVTDNSGATATDDVNIVVNAAPANIPPTCNAGPDQTITLPTNSIMLNGTASDSDGTIATIMWSKIAGSATALITNGNSLNTTVTNLGQGAHIFRLTVTDNNGAVATDDINVMVNTAAPSNIPPIVNAGPDQIINLSVSTVLNGTASDSDGTIVSYAWTKVSGPAGSVIGTPNMVSTVVSNLVSGVHVFKLTVTDNNGATSSSNTTRTIG